MSPLHCSYRTVATSSVSTLSSLTGKPLLLGRSSLSSLHPQDLPAVPGSVTFRQLLSPASWLPTPAHVERSTRDRTPWADLWQLKLPLTDFEHDGLLITQKVFPHRPLSVRRKFEPPIGSNNEITRMVYKTIRITSLSLRRAWTNTSRRIQLYCGTTIDCWLDNRPLAYW